MSRRMDYTVGLDEPVADVYRHFTSRQYWEDLTEAHRQSTESELTHFSCGGSGTDITLTHTLSGTDLPAFVSAVVPLRITVTREQHFDEFDPATGSADGGYNALIRSAPVDISGTYRLAQTATGSELRLSSVCKVKIPLVGGKIEGFVLNGLSALFDLERDFTQDWITRHH